MNALNNDNPVLVENYPIIRVEELAYAYGKPVAKAKFKSRLEDFIVRETLSFEPEGEGNQAYLYIEKKDTNTEWLARQLARFAGIEIRDVGYAGLKDRNGITSQWFSVKLEGVSEPDWDDFQLEGVKILKKTWHRKKLKRGAIKHNQFEVTLRDVSGAGIDELQQRIQQIRKHGVPNYFAQQRFGHDYNNLIKAAKWFNGNLKIKKRNDKSLTLSAARSMVFNQLVSHRINFIGWNQLLNGEIMMLNGSHSIFPVPENTQDIQERFQRGDIHPTTALWGRGQLNSDQQVLTLEKEVGIQLYNWCDGLEKQGLKQERRSLRLFPEDLTLSAHNTGSDPISSLTISFFLPTGSYATAVLREIVQF